MSVATAAAARPEQIRPTISLLEHGKIADPSAHLVKRLAMALDLDVNDLIEMIGEKRL